MGILLNLYHISFYFQQNFCIVYIYLYSKKYYFTNSFGFK